MLTFVRGVSILNSLKVTVYLCEKIAKGNPAFAEMTTLTKTRR
jgi:hypothetical protein